MKLPDSATNAGRFSRVAIAVVAGGGLALGITGLAQADPAPSASAPAASGPAASGAAEGPAGDAQRVHKPHLSGTVKSIDGGHIMIVDRDGFTRQINIATVPSDVKVGVRVHAEGTVNADGVSLDATAVTLAPDRPEGKRGSRPGGPGGPGEGPGKHERPGRDGTPPSGSPESGAPSGSSENGAPSESGAPSQNGAPSETSAPAPAPTS